MQDGNVGSLKQHVEALSRACGILTRCFLVFALAGVAFAQIDRSALNGTVTDSSGLALPATRVIAVEDSTGLQRTTVTSKNGTYEIPELPVGLYTVTFSHDGFQPRTF